MQTLPHAVAPEGERGMSDTDNSCPLCAAEMTKAQYLWRTWICARCGPWYRDKGIAAAHWATDGWCFVGTNRP